MIANRVQNLVSFKRGLTSMHVILTPLTRSFPSIVVRGNWVYSPDINLPGVFRDVSTDRVQWRALIDHWSELWDS